MSQYKAICGAAWPIFKLKQYLYPNNVPIKLEENSETIIISVVL